jgi:hypothetical protein
MSFLFSFGRNTGVDLGAARVTSQDMINTSHFFFTLVHLELHFFYLIDNNISFLLSFGRSTSVDLTVSLC